MSNIESPTNEQWSKTESQINQQERENVKDKERKSLEKLNVASGTVLESRWKRLCKQGEAEQPEEKKETLSKEAEELISLRWENLSKSFKEYKNKDDEIILDEILLQQAIEEIRSQDKRVISTRNKATDSIIDEINGLKKEQEELKQLSPEAYIGLNLRNFKEQIERVKRGMLMETDYVKSLKKETLKMMQSGEHIFLHGHLGGGKTDFAIDASMDRMVDLYVNREINQWMQDNPNVKEQEAARQYRRIKKKYEDGIKENDKEIMEKVTPFLIAGSKDFNLQDLYTEKSLTVTKFNGKKISEHREAMDEEYNKWKEENKEELSKLTDGQRMEKEREEANRILELYIMKHTGFGTEVEKIDKELKRAVKEGKPIVIDEANAIPPTLLISMNDILTKRPGESAYIPGEGPVEVKEGFSIIMTGNLETSSNLAEYFGTEEMNPAFLSRLNVREYNYLPQNKAGNFHEQEKPEKNELFQVVLSFLAEKDGSLRLPNGSMDKLFKLSQLSKTTQDVFSGRWEESDVGQDESGDEAIEPKLEKSVLSIRNIINVLKEWNKGQEKDLDMALWKAFISNATVASDQNFILNEAKKFGFFQDVDGWKVQPRDQNTPLASEEDIRIKEYEYIRPENYNYSPRDTVEILYGEAPERVKFPDVNIEAFSESDIDLEAINDLEQFEEEIGKYDKAFPLAMEKEGCAIK